MRPGHISHASTPPPCRGLTCPRLIFHSLIAQGADQEFPKNVLAAVGLGFVALAPHCHPFAQISQRLILVRTPELVARRSSIRPRDGFPNLPCGASSQADLSPLSPTSPNPGREASVLAWRMYPKLRLLDLLLHDGNDATDRGAVLYQLRRPQVGARSPLLLRADFDIRWRSQEVVYPAVGLTSWTNCPYRFNYRPKIFPESNTQLPCC